jgi:CelD/BcsL family acetyltransferase involved in cellulose biosynthesis
MKSPGKTIVEGQLENGKYTVKLIDPCNDVRWDSFVENHPYGWLTHLSSWGEILVRSFPHMKGYYLALTDSSDGAILAALPAYEVKSRILGRRLVSIPFATLADPLVTSPIEFNILAEALLHLAHDLRVDHVEIRTLHASPLIADQRMESQLAYKHHYLVLGQDPEELKRSFHRSCVRQRISKALESNLVLKVGKSEEDLKKLYILYRMTRKKIGLPPQPYIFFKMIWETLYPECRVDLLLAEKHQKTVAGLLLFKFKERVSAEFAVMDQEYHDESPNHFLFWEAIKRSTSEGYKVFDFGRTASSNHSLLTFKERWGTTVTDLPVFYYPQGAHNQSAAWENSMPYGLLRKMCMVAPNCLLEQIGHFCYKHMG